MQKTIINDLYKDAINPLGFVIATGIFLFVSVNMGLLGRKLYLKVFDPERNEDNAHNNEFVGSVVCEEDRFTDLSLEKGCTTLRHISPSSSMSSEDDQTASSSEQEDMPPEPKLNYNRLKNNFVPMTIQEFTTKIRTELLTWQELFSKNRTISIAKEKLAIKEKCRYFLFPIAHNIKFDSSYTLDELIEVQYLLVKIFKLLAIENEDTDLFAMFLSSAAISAVLNLDPTGINTWLSMDNKEFNSLKTRERIEEDYKDWIYIILMAGMDKIEAGEFHLRRLRDFTGIKIVAEEEEDLLKTVLLNRKLTPQLDP